MFRGNMHNIAFKKDLKSEKRASIINIFGHPSESRNNLYVKVSNRAASSIQSVSQTHMTKVVSVIKFDVPQFSIFSYGYFEFPTLQCQK